MNPCPNTRSDGRRCRSAESHVLPCRFGETLDDWAIAERARLEAASERAR